MSSRDIRSATYNVLRRHNVTTFFSNPGSTEIPFLKTFPDDFRFVLGLHEGSVVNTAAGWALGTGRPAVVQLHTSAGLGNAVGSIAQARAHHAPLVVIAGQVARRHEAFEPFLYGYKLTELAGRYPLDVIEPSTSEDVPAAVERAIYLSSNARGPVLMVIRQSDWDEPYDENLHAAPQAVQQAPRVKPNCTALIEAIMNSERPAIIAGAGNNSDRDWAALVQLAELLGAPVWQEAFGAMAGFPQNHPLFSGVIPGERPAVRKALERHDLVLVVGTAVLRQFPLTEGGLFPSNTRVCVVTRDPREAYRSTGQLALVGECADIINELSSAIRPRGRQASTAAVTIAAPEITEGSIAPEHVFAVVEQWKARDAALIEEAPSSRHLMQQLIPARTPLGYVSGALGSLGFAAPYAIGLKIALPDTEVIAIIGDGSAMYAIQALWTAVHERASVLFVVLTNGGYAVMDKIMEQTGGKPPWPSFDNINICNMALAMGCEAVSVKDQRNLNSVIEHGFDYVRANRGPFLVDCHVTRAAEYVP